MRTSPLCLLVLLASALRADEGITLVARWDDDEHGARVVAEGTVEVPDGGVLDVAIEFEGAVVARTEVEARSGRFHGEVRLGEWGYAGHYYVRVRFDPIAQDGDLPTVERALATLFPLERGRLVDAIAARWDAAQALERAGAMVREAITRARRAALEPEPTEAVARETAGLEARLRAAQVEVWPYLPLSRGAVDRLVGWARGRPTDGRAESLSTWFAIGERLAAGLERTLGYERVGERSQSENSPRPIASEAPDPAVAERAAREETTDEAIDALAPMLGRLGREEVERLRALLTLDVAAGRRAARLLGWVPHPAAIESLRAAASPGDPAVRAEALRSLGRLGDGASSAAIQAALADPSASVRAAAVEAIVLLGGEDRAPLLFPLVADPDPGVGKAARDAVRRLAGDWPSDLPSEAVDGATEALRRWWFERSGQP